MVSKVVFIPVLVFDSPVASWISHASFMRWGFEGMLELQFKGKKYPVSIENITIEVDGMQVSKKHYENPHCSEPRSRRINHSVRVLEYEKHFFFHYSC